MFTGIVTDVGRLVGADDRNDGRRLRIATNYDAAGIDLGASIALDGICLTVTDRGKGDSGNWFEVFAALETLAVTRISGWKLGRRINLERALRVGDELGGHSVSGHVDGMACIVGKRPVNEQIALELEAPEALAPFIARKGSVALNGTSLTVNEVAGRRFSVHLIPHTVAVTTWADYGVGDEVTIEVDPMARYAARLMEAGRPQPGAAQESAMSAPYRILVIEARFYEDMADELFHGAQAALEAAGATYERISVPGVLEIPAALAMALEAGRQGRGPVYDGFLALGVVIRGETTHYDIVANESARALMDLAVANRLAFGNGIQTVENDDQAWARVRRDGKDKGGAAARAALHMAALKRQLAP